MMTLHQEDTFLCGTFVTVSACINVHIFSYFENEQKCLVNGAVILTQRLVQGLLLFYFYAYQLLCWTGEVDHSVIVSRYCDALCYSEIGQLFYVYYLMYNISKKFSLKEVCAATLNRIIIHQTEIHHFLLQHAIAVTLVYSFDTFFSFWPLLSEVCLHCGPSSFYLHHRSYHVIALGMLGNLPVPLISIIWYWPSGNDSQWSEDWYCNGHASQIQWLSTRNVASSTFFGQRVVCGV